MIRSSSPCWTVWPAFCRPRDIADELTAKGVATRAVSQRKHLTGLYEAGAHTQAELAELFSVSRATVYRELQRRTMLEGPARLEFKG